MSDKIQYRGYTINIMTDENPPNPRTDWDNLGTMICWHSRYDLGDKNGFDTPEEAWAEIKNHIVLPLYLYDHSGITMNTTGFTCQWDSGRVGYIYVSLEKVRKEYGWKHITKRRKEKVLECLRGEVAAYDDFLTGNVYGYSIAGNGNDIDDGDSCWGYLGDPDESGCIDDAKSAIDHMCKRKQEEYEKQPKKKAAESYSI